MHNHANISTFMTRLYSSVVVGIFAFTFVRVTRRWPEGSTDDWIDAFDDSFLLRISSSWAATGSLHSVSSAFKDK